VNELKRQQQREVVRQWFKDHPGYSKVHLANQQKLQAEQGCALNGTLPVKSSKKITYPITIRRPLKPHEPGYRTPPEPHRRKKNPHATNNNSEEEFFPCDI
jgi:hypothetical protein